MMGSFQAFTKEATKRFGLSKTTLRNHFKGKWEKDVKGEKYFVPPHFSVSGFQDQIEEGLDEDRIVIEKTGMELVKKKLGEAIQRGDFLTTKEIVSLYSAMTKSHDSRKNIDIKERALDSGNKNFDKLVAAAMYGGKPPKIIDAEIDDSTECIKQIDGGAEDEPSEEDSEREV